MLWHKQTIALECVLATIKLHQKWVVGGALAASLMVLGVGQAVLQDKAEAQRATVQAPTCEVDPFRSKPLPNGWLLGMTIGA